MSRTWYRIESTKPRNALRPTVLHCSLLVYHGCAAYDWGGWLVAALYLFHSLPRHQRTHVHLLNGTPPQLPHLLRTRPVHVVFRLFPITNNASLNAPACRHRHPLRLVISGSLKPERYSSAFRLHVPMLSLYLSLLLCDSHHAWSTFILVSITYLGFVLVKEMVL
jgi:hypothetical protein